MKKPKVSILYAPGVNCHHETADAFRLAGGDPFFTNLTDDLIPGRKKLSDCDILAVPGGFSFGDHVAAGRIFAIDLTARLKDQLAGVIERGIPVIGICNGFQVLVNTGLLPGSREESDKALLDRNASAVFESRWVTLQVEKSPCIWTGGLEGESLRIPVAHGEGRLIVPPDFDDNQTVFRYGIPDGSPDHRTLSGTMDYPANPNASPGGRAGICDPSGRILGLMPHPERAVYPWLGSADGLKILETGVSRVK